MKLPTLRVASLTALFTVFGSVFMLLPSTFAQDVGGPTFQGGRMHGPGMGGPRHGRGGRGPGDPADMIENLDTNGDGKVSLEEFREPRLSHIDEMFERRDADHDGLIAEGEGRPGRPAAATTNAPARGDRPGRGARIESDQEALIACVREAIPDFDPQQGSDAADIEARFDAVDTTDDGKLSLAEVTTAVQARATADFNKLDTDADGFITTDEIETQQAARQDVRRTVQACAKQLATG